jgi:tetratricopeptide (TPR) repeat protein
VLGNFEEALSLSPNDYRVLSTVGAADRFNKHLYDEGIELIERSVELNPADAANVYWLSQHLFYLERWQDAILHAETAIRIAPNAPFGHAHLALLAAMSGDDALARTSAARAEALDLDAYSIVDIATAYGQIGDTEAAKRLFDGAYKGGLAATQDPFWQFRMHAAVGNVEEAMGFLEDMVDSGFPMIGNLTLHRFPDHPMFDVVRSEPGFAELITLDG